MFTLTMREAVAPLCNLMMLPYEIPLQWALSSLVKYQKTTHTQNQNHKNETLKNKLIDTCHPCAVLSQLQHSCCTKKEGVFYGY